MKVVAPCKLCGVEAELQDSHVIPKFYFRWLKKTGSQYGRNPLMPNRRIQDGLSPKLLCKACEGRFSKLESSFANKHFHPIVKTAGGDGELDFQEIEYTEQLYLFGLSLLWRVMLVGSFYEANTDNGRVVTAAAKLAETHLLEGEPCGLEIHMAVLGACPGLGLTKFFSSYMARSPDGCTPTDEQGRVVYTFAKMGPFMFFMPHREMKAGWLKGGQLKESGGLYRAVVVESDLLGFLVHRAGDGREMVDRGISSKQKGVMRKSMWRSLKENPNSQHSRIVLSDLEALRTQRSARAKPGRNEPCPCGSEKKYKRCCL